MGKKILLFKSTILNLKDFIRKYNSKFDKTNVSNLRKNFN